MEQSFKDILVRRFAEAFDGKVDAGKHAQIVSLAEIAVTEAEKFYKQRKADAHAVAPVVFRPFQPELT